MTEYQAELIEQGDQEALGLAVEEVMATLPAAGEVITRLTRPLLTLDGPPDPASIRLPS